MTRLETLRSAVRCAIRHRCPRSEIDVAEWARSYSVTMKAVRDVWSDELTKIPPSPTYEEGDGK